MDELEIRKIVDEQVMMTITKILCKGGISEDTGLNDVKRLIKISEKGNLKADYYQKDDKIPVRPEWTNSVLDKTRYGRIIFSREDREQIHEVLMKCNTWIDELTLKNGDVKLKELEMRCDFELVQMMYLALKETAGV